MRTTWLFLPPINGPNCFTKKKKNPIFSSPRKKLEPQKRKNCLGCFLNIPSGKRSHRAGKSPCLIPSFSSKIHRNHCRMLALPHVTWQVGYHVENCVGSQKSKLQSWKKWRKNQVQWRIFKFYPERDTIHEDLLIFLGLRSLQCWFDLSFNWPIKNFTSNAPNQTKNIHPKKKTLTNMFHPINFDKTLPKKQHCLA